MGVKAAPAHLRAINEVQVERACTLGWAYRDAEAAGYDGLLGDLHEQVRRSRAKWTACALAAQAAADAARGAKEALDCHESGEPWRRMTGSENGMLLIELKDRLDARRREREDEPV